MSLSPFSLRGGFWWHFGGNVGFALHLHRTFNRRSNNGVVVAYLPLEALMAWLHQLSGTYHTSFRFGGQKFKRSLRTSESKEAEARLERLKENIRLVEAGRIDLPAHSDIPTFLLSDGKTRLQTEAKVEATNIRTIHQSLLQEHPERFTGGRYAQMHANSHRSPDRIACQFVCTS